MARPIRVLQLRDSPWVDGPGRTIVETAAYLDTRRVEYHVGALVPDGAGDHPLVDALRARGAPVHPLVDRGGLDRVLLGDISHLAAELGIDIVHSSEFRTNLLTQLCRLDPSVKRVCTVHGWITNAPRARLIRVLDKALLRRFHAVIMVSAATRRLVPRWWLPDRRVSVLHNGLVLDRYGADTGPRRARAAFGDDPVVLLNVGRLSPEKGQDLLIRAFAEVAADCPDLRLWIAGTGPEEENLHSLVTALKLDNRVEFLSYVHDMPALYAQSDLVVQSSLTEGLPNVILEAAYLRAPILATDVGGTAEVVEHERSAWLIRPGSRADLVAGIRRFLRQPADFAAMAERAHEAIVARFSFDYRTDRLMEFYESVGRGTVS